MKKETAILVMVIIIALSMIPHQVYSQNEFKIVDFTGEWEVAEPDHIKSKPSSGHSYIVLEYSNVVLGSWLTTIDLTATGQQGDTIETKYTIDIPELNFTLTYLEKYNPGWIFDIGSRRKNELKIELNGEIVYNIYDEADWPFDTRLNTRIYFGIWRIDKDNLEIRITDYYGQINGNRSIYWTQKIGYNGESLTLTLRIDKNSQAESTVEAYLYYNTVERDKIIGENIEVRLLNIDSAALFYASLGFLIIAIVANFTSRTWKYYEKKLEKPEEPKKKGKHASRGK